jgi:hypothetical protein
MPMSTECQILSAAVRHGLTNGVAHQRRHVARIASMLYHRHRTQMASQPVESLFSLSFSALLDRVPLSLPMDSMVYEPLILRAFFAPRPAPHFLFYICRDKNLHS